MVDEWLRALAPAVVVAVGGLVGYGRLQERQRAQGESIAELKAAQVPRTEIQAMFGGLASKIDDLASTTRHIADRLDSVIERRIAQAPTERERRES